MNRSDRAIILEDLKALASRAYDAEVTIATQRAIDYAVSELAAECEPSRDSHPPTANDEIRSAASRAFRKSRELVRSIK
jgi:hypothetical protein